MLRILTVNVLRHLHLYRPLRVVFPASLNAVLTAPQCGHTGPSGQRCFLEECYRLIFIGEQVRLALGVDIAFHAIIIR